MTTVREMEEDVLSPRFFPFDLQFFAQERTEPATPKKRLRRLRSALDALIVGVDGVDGSLVFLFGTLSLPGDTNLNATPRSRVRPRLGVLEDS